MSLTNDIIALRHVELFSSFNEDQLRLLAFGSQKMTFHEGHELFQNGQVADGGLLILSGEILLELHSENKPSTIKSLGPGNLIGEMALFTRNRRTGTATVKQDAEVLKIRRDVMHRVLGEFPELAADLYHRISRNIVSVGRDLEKVDKRLQALATDQP